MEAWTPQELAALEQRDKARIWLVELELRTGIWRATQTVRNLVDAAGRVWTSQATGDVQGMGSSYARRPREVRLTLHGIQKSQSVFARLNAAVAIGAPAKVFMAWVDANDVLIVQPKLRFAGIVEKTPEVALGANSDRATLSLRPGTERANRLSSPWDRSPASHRSYVGVTDPIFDRVTTHTQQPVQV